MPAVTSMCLVERKLQIGLRTIKMECESCIAKGFAHEVPSGKKIFSSSAALLENILVEKKLQFNLHITYFFSKYILYIHILRETDRLIGVHVLCIAKGIKHFLFWTGQFSLCL